MATLRRYLGRAQVADIARSAGLGLLFALVGLVVALVRLRTSPWYPRFNDVNSDVYVFQMVGNSWRYGFLPYRDVYDVKGPFLYLLFGGFAQIRPWSMGLPLAFLVVLATCSVWLGYVIARLYVARGWAAMSAVCSCLAIYLGVADVNTSFTCEELAVPGVLLMLWLVLRWLRSGVEIRAGWWVVDGLVFGALFWTKYQVIAPWAGVFIALIVLTILRRLPLPAFLRMAGWNLLGLVAATAAILPFYTAVLPEMGQAYFLGKRGSIDLAGELPAQRAWVVRTVTENTGATLMLTAVLAVFAVYWIRRREADGVVLTVGLVLTMWASATFVRHPNHLFVPLSFSAAALAMVLAAATSPDRHRGRIWTRVTAVAAVVGTALLITGPLMESRASMSLLRAPKRMTCYNFTTDTATTSRAQVSTVFARASGNRSILSIGTLFAARSSFISRQPMRHPFEFVDHSWASTVGARTVQTRYLKDGTLGFVWIHVEDPAQLRDRKGHLERADLDRSEMRPEQASAILRNYSPVVTCNRELLLRLR